MQVVFSIKKHWDIQNLFLWGGSFGGCLGSLCLERFPEQFSGVILSSPAITFSREEALQFYSLMKKPYAHRFNDSVVKTLSPLDAVSPEEFFAEPQVCQFIFKIPTLIMQGKNDPICQYQYIDNQITKENNSNIEYYLYDQCGHEVFTDKESEFICNIEKFIRRIVLC